MLTKAFTIPGAVSDLQYAEKLLYDKYHGKQYRYAWPELKTPGYALGGSTSYYWCVAYVRRLYQIATGWDLAAAIGGGWASTTYQYNWLAMSPSTKTVAPASARFGDIAIVGYNHYTTHTFIVGGTGSSRWLPTSEGDGSSPQFPGSETTGGVLVRKTRDMNIYSNHTGMSSGYFIRIWRMPLTGKPIRPVTPPAPPALKVDGYLGAGTIRRWQQVMGTPVDGKITPGGSTLVRAVQTYLNAHGATDERGRRLVVDGICDFDNTQHATPKQHTIAALQRYLNTPNDGVYDCPSTGVKALQTALNKAKIGGKAF